MIVANLGDRLERFMPSADLAQPRVIVIHYTQRSHGNVVGPTST
ncbi:hypothetical protein ACWEPC_09945 [Nonomuraea sp. NPDC004297]